MIMASTEFGEVYEPFVKGRGASSTMPQKRNPISSELMLAAVKAVRQHAGLMVDAMIQDFERATGPWHAEWIAMPESFILTAGALHQAKFALGGLIVDEAAHAPQPRHQPRPDRRRGGDDGPGARTSAASRRTTSSTTPAAPSTSRAARWPKRSPRRRRLPAGSTAPPIDRLTDPANYLGLAPQMVDRALALPPTGLPHPPALSDAIHQPLSFSTFCRFSKEESSCLSGTCCSNVMALAVATPSAFAQDYPTKPIVVTMPYSAGGPGDTLSRIVARAMTKVLGQQFIVDNAAGAGGTIGSAKVARESRTVTRC